MLNRSVARLWTPKYFRGQSATAARHPGPRRTRIVDSGHGTAPPPSTPLSGKKTGQHSPRAKTELQQTRRAAELRPSPTVAPPPPLGSLARQAQELLLSLTRPADTTAEAVSNYVAFTARRDVLSRLRQLLPAAQGRASSLHVDSAMSARSGTGQRRLRVVADPTTEPPLPSHAPSSGSETSPLSFTLDELAIFLQLYEAVAAEDGQLLSQLMAEVHRQLFAYADAHHKKQVMPRPTATTAQPSFSSPQQERRTHHDAGEDAMNAAAARPDSTTGPTLPLPRLLFTMSSLGLVEEAVLSMTTSAATVGETPVRRGLLYHQLPRYSTEELVILVVALHRFGHAQQPSMKAVTKALRASLYNRATTAGSFHRAMRELKRRHLRTQRKEKATPEDEKSEPMPEQAPLRGGSDEAGDSLVAQLHHNTALHELVLRIHCPVFILLEALTATSLTVYRRTDVVSFLSDLIAVTAVMELTTALQESRMARPRTSSGSDSEEYVLFVAHQLLRAAKLTEAMEQPQPLLSEVFAWSCTLSGRKVFVDGGEDSDVPSNRVAFYDHVTADLVKVNRTD